MTSSADGGFVGLRVRIARTNGMDVEGTVTSVDAASKRLSLSQVVVRMHGIEQKIENYSVGGKDIKDLSVVPLVVQQVGLQPAPYQQQNLQQNQQVLQQNLQTFPATNASYLTSATSSIYQTHGIGSLNADFIPQTTTNRQRHPSASKSVTAGTPTPETPSSRKQTQQRNSGSSSRSKHRSNRSKPGIATTSHHQTHNNDTFGTIDMDEVSEDFDFQASLSRFDKKKVFESLKMRDKVDPMHRLVSHNRKIPWNENVMDSIESDTGDGGGETADGDPDDDATENALLDRIKYEDDDDVAHEPHIERMLAESMTQRIPLDDVPSGPGGRKYHFDTIHGVYVPPTTHHDAKKSEFVRRETVPGILSSDSFSQTSGSTMHGKKSAKRASVPMMTSVSASSSVTQTDDFDLDVRDIQTIDNGGRGISAMVMQALNGSNNATSAVNIQRTRSTGFLQPDRPTVIVLAGNNRTGLFGLASARHLVSRGCSVIAYTVGTPETLQRIVQRQQSQLLSSGGTIVQSVSDLPDPVNDPVDVVIDALMNMSDQTVMDMPKGRERGLTRDAVLWANRSKAPRLCMDVPLPTSLQGDAAIHVSSGTIAKDKIGHAQPSTYPSNTGIVGTSGTNSTSLVSAQESSIRCIQTKWIVTMGLVIFSAS